jgi:hypothetical protein
MNLIVSARVKGDARLDAAVVEHLARKMQGFERLLVGDGLRRPAFSIRRSRKPQGQPSPHGDLRRIGTPCADFRSGGQLKLDGFFKGRHAAARAPVSRGMSAP